MFVERFMHFMNLWTVYTDFLKGKYVPSVGGGKDDESETGMYATLMFVLYAFFYSLVEDSPDSTNGFRVWRQRFPEEEPAIARVEAQVLPFVSRLRVFRNRMGFHGSRSRSHESPAFDLFEQHSGEEIWNAMKSFKSLGAALLAKENAARGNPRFTAEQVREWIDRIAS